MRSIVRFAFLVALAISFAQILSAQSSPNQTPSTQPSTSSSQTATQGQGQQTPSLTQQQMTVQDRIRMRREQRRQQAIRDTYSHRYDAYLGMGYLRFTPGKYLQRVTLYAWDTGLTRYYNLHLGVTADVRGYYGTPFIYPNPNPSNGSVNRPAISQYDFLVGPTYRFMLHPKYALSARAMGGYAKGNFTGDTNGFGRICYSGSNCYLWPDGGTYAVTGALLGEYNVTPGVALRLGVDDFVTGFGSTMQNSVGFTGGFVLRFGKQ
jgi:hypothetical protein